MRHGVTIMASTCTARVLSYAPCHVQRLLLGLVLLANTLAACATPEVKVPERIDSEAVHHYFAKADVTLPSDVAGVPIRRTGSDDLGDVPILLFNKGGGETRRLIVLVHGWGGNQLKTWEELPLLFLDPGRSKEFGGTFDVLVFGYPSGALAEEQALIYIGERARNTFVRVVNGLTADAPKYGEVFFLAHSMGAPIVQYAIVSMMTNPEDRKITESFLERVRGFVFIAPLNGRLVQSIQSVAEAFDDHQVVGAGPFGGFRRRLEAMWTEAEVREDFKRLFQTNTMLVHATADRVIDNTTVTERFKGVKSVPVSGGHVSVVKVRRETDELFGLVIRPFLNDRRGTGAGLEVSPRRVTLIPNEAPCADVSLVNKDQTQVHWGMSKRPKGYFMYPSKGVLQPKESRSATIVLTREEGEEPALEVEWKYAVGRTATKIRIDLDTKPAAKPGVLRQDRDSCAHLADALALFDKREYAAASMAINKADSMLFGLKAVPEVVKSAGLIELRGGRPEEAVKWWTKLAEHDDLGKIYLAGTLVALGQAQAAQQELKTLHSPVELTAIQFQEVKLDFSMMVFETAGLSVALKKTRSGSLNYEIVKALAYATVRSGFANYKLSQEQVRELRQFAELARTMKGIVKVTGYASEFGGKKANLTLAESRAKEVVRTLVTAGIDRPRIVVEAEEGFPLREWMAAGELGRGVTVQLTSEEEGMFRLDP